MLPRKASLFLQLQVAVGVVVVTALAVRFAGLGSGMLLGLVVAGFVAVSPQLKTQIDVKRARLMGGSVRPAASKAETSDEIVIARLSGALTFMAQGQLARLLDGPPWPRLVVLDLARVTFVDGGGVGELEYAVEFLAIRGASVAIVAASPRNAALLSRARVLPKVVGARVFPTVDEALAAFDPDVTRGPDRSAPALEASEPSIAALERSH